MKREHPRGAADYAPLAFPALMLVVFFVIPFAIMIAVSFYQRETGAFYTPAFVLDNYGRFLSAFFGARPRPSRSGSRCWSRWSAWRWVSRSPSS